VLQGAAVDLTQWLGVDGITADDEELLLAEAAIDTSDSTAAAAAVSDSAAVVAIAATAVDLTAALQDVRIEAQLIEVRPTCSILYAVLLMMYVD
jgi:hypothetical protein